MINIHSALVTTYKYLIKCCDNGVISRLIANVFVMTYPLSEMGFLISNTVHFVISYRRLPMCMYICQDSRFRGRLVWVYWRGIIGKIRLTFNLEQMCLGNTRCIWECSHIMKINRLCNKDTFETNTVSLMLYIFIRILVTGILLLVLLDKYACASGRKRDYLNILIHYMEF